MKFLTELNELTVVSGALNEMAGKKAPYNFDHRHRYDYGFDSAHHDPGPDDHPTPEVTNPEIERMLGHLRSHGGKLEALANSIAASGGSNIGRIISQLNDDIAKRQSQEGGLPANVAKNFKNLYKILADLDKLYHSMEHTR